MAMYNARFHSNTSLTPKELKRKLFSLGMMGLSTTREFFATCSEVDMFYETSDYFFKVVRMFGVKELRLWKKSKRVSVSQTMTNPNNQLKQPQVRLKVGDTFVVPACNIPDRGAKGVVLEVDEGSPSSEIQYKVKITDLGNSPMELLPEAHKWFVPAWVKPI